MFQKIKEAVDRGRRFLVATHIDPDGDAIGSAFALCFALRSLGKDAAVYMRDGIPYRYAFLPKPEPMIREIPKNGYDTVLIVDCGDLARVGDGHETLNHLGYLINIDHHDTNDAFGQINIVDERASSSAELLYLILKALGVTFSYEIAISLYTAVLTDTGSFRYDSTTQRAFSICEEMTGFGVVPSRVAGEVYESHPKERYLLLCRVLGTLEFFSNDRIATAYVTRDMFATTGTNREHTEGFVEYIKEIRGIEVACVIRELDNGKFKVSMRSKGNVDVALTAQKFGGGGHQKAAGCTIEGDISDVKNKLTGALSL
jgi:bifunctional oligoribonuclease and PAP phosphatase NrnA